MIEAHADCRAHSGGPRDWRAADIETYETLLATDAAGSGGVLADCMAVSTNVYAVLSDTASAAQSHIVVCTKSRLAERTTPTALALTDLSKSVFAVSFGNLDLGANHVGGDVSWTPPEIDAGIETYESYLATDAASSGGALAGSMAVSVTPSRSGTVHGHRQCA